MVKHLQDAFPKCRKPRFDPWVGKIPWRRKWQPIPVCLPGEFWGQRSLVDYSPWDCKELDMTKWLTHTHRCWQEKNAWQKRCELSFIWWPYKGTASKRWGRSQNIYELFFFFAGKNKTQESEAINKFSLHVYFNHLCCAKSLQSCLTLCNPMDYSPPDFSLHEILQSRILE